MKKVTIVILAAALLLVSFFLCPAFASSPSAENETTVPVLFIEKNVESTVMYIIGNQVRERTGPSTAFDIVTEHMRGKDVLVESITDGWAKLVNGNYICADYLVAEEDVGSLFYDLPMFVIGNNVHIRTAPSLNSSVVSSRSIGDKVRVAARENADWFRLMDGNYISAQFVSADLQDIVPRFAEKHPDFVVTYISRQYVECYIDGSVQKAGDCVTGNESTSPTPTGLYEIYHKNHDFDMNGNPRNHVRVFSVFNGGIGFHDADMWRSSYGGTIYKGHGSHGCVNCGLELAQFIYDSYGIGTPVLVLP